MSELLDFGTYGFGPLLGFLFMVCVAAALVVVPVATLVLYLRALFGRRQ